MKHNLKFIRTAAILLAAGIALSGCAQASGNTDTGGAEITTIRFGSVGGLTDAGLYIADAKGYFEEAGIKVTFERMGGGSEIGAAIATGNLDVAGFALTAGFFNAIAEGLELKIVGDKQSILPGASATRIVTRPEFVGDNPQETFDNLRGKIMAVSAQTSATVAALDFALAGYGLSIDDFDLREMGYPEITASLQTGQIDAAVELEPFLTTALDAGLVDIDDLTGTVDDNGGTLVPLVYSQRFIDENPDAADAFMTAYMKGVREYNEAFLDDVNKQEIAEIIAEASGQKLDLVLRAKVAGLSSDQVVSVEFIEKIQDWFVERGLVTKPIDAKSVIDVSFAEKAQKELK
jgi:NitT/TauT family transport system substrate-binding protein